MADRYERAVYDEETEALLNAVLDACGSICLDPSRIPIIAAALMTAAQVLDGNDMPAESKIIRPGGIAAMLALLIAEKNPPDWTVR